MIRLRPLFSIVILTLCWSTVHAKKKDLKLLVFSKTMGFRHSSIAQGKTMFLEMGINESFKADTTEDAAVFTPENLKQYHVVVFLNTTGDALNDMQQAAFEKYIQGGGKFLGIHAAADTEYQWPWYNKLVGAYFSSHPKPQNLEYINKAPKHPAVSFWPERIKRFEEIYDFKSVQKDLITIALLADEKTYEGGTMGEFHPAAWYHHFDGGKAFYTALGHHPETYADADFRKHILGAIKWLVKK